VTDTLPQVLEWTTISEIVSFGAVCFVKLSVSVFVLRVIHKTHQRLRVTLYCFMVFLAITGLAAMLAVGLQCIPIRKLWDPSLSGRCFKPVVSTAITQVFGGKSGNFIVPPHILNL